MTLQKQYQFKGLNLRQSDILIPPEFASYASNCDLNYSGELRKRNGFQLSATAPLDIIYLVEYKQANELLAMCSDGLYKKVGADFSKIPMSITGPVPSWDGDITSVELNGTTYFSDTTGTNPVFKYDGITFTQAGVHEPKVSGQTGQIIPSLSTADQFFGKVVKYANGLTADDQGQLMIMGGGGLIYQFIDTDFGYQSVESNINSDTPGQIVGGAFAEIEHITFDISQDGNILVRLSNRTRIEDGFLRRDLFLNTYQRLSSNTDWTKISALELIHNWNWQVERIGRLKISKDGTKVVFNKYPYGTSDGVIYTYRQSGAVGTWAAAPLLWGGANAWFGLYFDLNQEDTNNYFLAVTSERGNTSRGVVYLYKYDIAANTWGTAIVTINSPNAAAWNQDVFGNFVTLISNKSNTVGELMLFIPYREPGTQTNNKMYVYFIKLPATIVAGTPYIITMPANIFGTIVTVYEDLAEYRNYLTISAPNAATSKGPKTFGQAIVYNWTFQGNVFDFIQQLHPPETSYDNAGSVYTQGTGFSANAVMITRDPVTNAPRIAIAYPGFNVLNINNRGKVYTYRTDQVNMLTSGWVVDAETTQEQTSFARYYLSYVDANGNLINSEAKTQTFNGERLKITVRTSKNTKYNDRYFIDDMTNFVGQTFNTTPSVTIGSVDHNVVVGDKVLVKTYTKNEVDLGNVRPIEFQLVEVIGVTSSNVTIDVSKIADNTYVTNSILWNGVGLRYPINGSNQYINIFVSKDEFFNYELLDNPSGQEIITHEEELYDVEIEKVVFSEDPDIFLNDIYDDTVLKKEIPHIRYLGTYQNLLLGVNIKYPTEQEKAEFKNRFIWSDASIGGSVETFAPFDYEIIGENIAKELTAVIGTQDNIHVFKNRKCYAISGILIGGQYRVRELISEETGCVNHNSMIAARGQVMFMSEAGLYSVAGGANPSEVTDANQPLFMAPNIDLYRSVSCFDGKLERVYTFLKHTLDPTKNSLVVWNYYFNQWFLYEGMGMSGPMIVYNDRLNIADGKYLKEMRDNIFTDLVMPGGATKPVFFKYYTGWFHLGFPSIRKKFVNLVLFSILRLRDYAAIPFEAPRAVSEPPNFSLDIKTQLDWIATDWDNFNVPFETNKRVDDHKLTQTQCQSLRYLIENNRNEPVLLTGYEFEWESTQDKPKGLT